MLERTADRSATCVQTTQSRANDAPARWPDASKLVGITKPANARVLSTAMIDDLEGVVSEKQG
jgi:hypothetical protein